MRCSWEGPEMSSDRTITRVILADDHPAFRIGLRVLLDREADICVVGEARDGPHALQLCLTLVPEVLVIDCRLPRLEGAAVVRSMTERGLNTRALALSAYDEDRFLTAMAQAGAAGYLLKDEAPTRIVASVRKVAMGENLWSPNQLSRVTHYEAQVDAVRDSLTEREREVLELLAEGLSNKEIAQALIVTLRTVEFHVSNVLRKLGVMSRVEAAVWAHEHLLER